MATKEVIKVYQLVLDGPGMRDLLKVSLPMTRRQLFMICRLVENGIDPTKEKSDEIAALLSKDLIDELAKLMPEMLRKGGADLAEYYERLKLL